jgi:hypothetical protein
MASKNIDNVFFIEDMTSLRYAIPFLKMAKRCLGIEIQLAFDSSYRSGQFNFLINKFVEKYNSINIWINRFHSIVEENGIKVIDIANFSSSLSVHNLFCVENCFRKIDSKNCYSFQHGFDYINLHNSKINSIYLTHDDFAKYYLSDKGIACEPQPFPVVFWDWEYQMSKAKITNQSCATLFYPENGYHDIFLDIYAEIKRKGYDIYVKQRKKHQSVPDIFQNVHYDFSWYPSESIVLPMISDFCVGFGTSAYTDVTSLNRQFIDLCLPDFAKSFHKPSLENFYCVKEDFYESFCRLQLKQVSTQDKIKVPYKQEEIDRFLIKVLSQ